MALKTNQLDLQFYDSIEEAPTYTSPEYKGAELQKAVLVRKGTVGGNATVDLIFADEMGQKYIAMITARLLQQLLGVM